MQEAAKAKAMTKISPAQKAQLATIEEEKKGEEDVYDMLKKKASGPKQTEFKFNQRAYKKYHSTRSLVDRILKSHSEGNRFIRNEDL